MVLDGPVQTEPVEQRTYVQLLAKKRSLEVPSKILLQGADHLKNLQNETKGSRSPEDFHIELLRLRQNWRLKKVGNTILGDMVFAPNGQLASRHYLAMKRLIEDNSFDGLAIRCWPELPGPQVRGDKRFCLLS